MPLDPPDIDLSSAYRRSEPDPSSGFRAATATLGLILVTLGSLLTLLLFWRLYQVFLDPRPLEAQVDRWEFVIRGKATDDVIPVETPVVNPGDPAQSPFEPARVTSGRPANEVEAVAQIAGRVGSKAARPAAILIMLVLLGILVRIVLGLIDVGGRLTYNAAGDRELLKRLVRELNKRP